jgi:RNA 2',3'-cyclic 3'-phosphodiesterase
MRLFTAIELPNEVLVRLERLLAALRPEALIKWSPLDNLHITMKFIGEWPREKLEVLHETLSSLPHRDAFQVELKDLGWFPNIRSPRVLWAGVHCGPEIGSLAREIEERLASIGVAKENREFTPHLTLARIRNPAPLTRLKEKVQEFGTMSLGTFQVAGFSLVLSEPGSNASIYSTLRRYAFASSVAAGKA